MGFTLPVIFAFFTVAIVASHAALTPGQYWNKVLPRTSMPKAIIESLNAEFMQNKSASITIGKGVDQSKVGLPPFPRFHYGNPPPRVLYGATNAAPTLKDDTKVAYFFLETVLVPGKTFNLQFIKAAGPASFLPREMADSIPFSSHNITKIFNRFSIDHQSKEANIMRETIRICEAPRISGERKYCATSLESMIDFSTKILGKKNVRAVSTGSDKDTQIKKYKIEASMKILTGDKEMDALSVVCHKLAYVYSVFYCHNIKSTKVYMVPLKSENGTEVKAIAVCHEDTSKWSPKHMAFRITKVKPGTIPICHFLADDTVVWYQN